MAFLKKKAYNKTCKSVDSERENSETPTSILQSIFTNIKDVDIITIDDDEKDGAKQSFSNPDDYKMLSSPVSAIETSFDTDDLHNPKCPTETKKPTNINLYTRYDVNTFSNLPTYYLVWYNVVISTGYRNHQKVCCASVKICISTIVGSSGFMCHLQQNICCETRYTTNIETVEKIEENIYLDSITSSKGDIFDTSSLSSIFLDFYNILLSVFEETYPSCIIFGMNNIIIKNSQIDINKIFILFLDRIKTQYSFYYKQINDTSLTDDIQKIQSWLASPITEKLSCLESIDGNLDFLGLLE